MNTPHCMAMYIHVNTAFYLLGKWKRIYLDCNEDVKTGFRSRILNYVDISDLAELAHSF